MYANLIHEKSVYQVENQAPSHKNNLVYEMFMYVAFYFFNLFLKNILFNIFSFLLFGVFFLQGKEREFWFLTYVMSIEISFTVTVLCNKRRWGGHREEEGERRGRR